MRKSTFFRCSRLLCALLALLAVPTARAFQHPGIALTLSDLDNIKTNLNNWPWSDGYYALTSDWLSNTNYGMHGPATYVNRNNGGNYDNENSWKSDMQAIYNQARMWYFTGDYNYGQKAHDMLLAWANTMTNFGGIESSLDLGDYAYRYAEGADILRGTWPGWTTADTLTVSNFFRNVYLPATGVGTSTGTLGPSNKGVLQLAGALGCAVFMDDTNLFDQILYLLRTSASCGLDNNCLSSGEMGETGRDQGHAYNDLLKMAWCAEVFYKQGIDIYSEDDNRLLACGEYWSRNNMNPPAAYITYGTTDYIYWNDSPGTNGNSAGGYFAADPMMGNILRTAYVLRKGLRMPWTIAKRYAQAGTTVVNAQGENEDSFCYLRSADTSTAAPPAAITYPPAPTITSGLVNVDIGTVGVSGSGSYSGGNWNVTGGGAEVWTHSADSCHFVCWQVTGDCTIIAKVNAVPTYTAATAKAGVMIRDSLSPNSSTERAWVAITASSSIEAYNNAWSQIYGGANWEHYPYSGVSGWLYTPGMPYWVKLQRLGNTVSTYISQDGTSWEVTTVAVYDNLPSTTYLGLFVCALNTSTACSASFSSVSITGGNGGNVTIPPAPYAVYASPDAGEVPLRWLQSFGATSYNVLRSTTNGGPYTTIATGVTNASYVDTAIAPDTTYYYVIQAVNSAGTSTNSPEDSATTAPTPPAPSGLAALPGNAQATLVWPAASTATSYNVKRSTTSGSGYVTVTNVTGLTAVNTGLTNGTTYYYVVASVNDAGEGTNSAEAAVTPGATATTLFWNGAVNGTWDTSTANWLKNGTSAAFANGNSVIFADSASANTTITLSAARAPDAIVFNNSSKSYTFNGSAVGGTGSLIKFGGGSLTLSSANTYSGGTTNNGGTLTLGNGSALGTGGLTLNGGTLNNSANISIANNITVNGSAAIQLGSGNNLTLSGTISGNGNLLLGSDGNVNSVYLAGVNSMAGGNITIAGNNNYVRFASTAAGNPNANWTINSTANHCTFDFSSGAISFGSLAGSGFIQGNVNGANSMNVTISVGANNNSTTFSGVIHNNGWGTGPIGLTKVGAGTLTLTGANDYTGDTTVAAGALVVSTASLANGNYSVANGARLAFTNLSSSSALVSNLTLSAGSTLEFQNVTSTTVPLAAASNMTVSGGCAVKIAGTNGFVAGNSYPLIGYSGAFTGSFTNLQLQMPYGWRGALTQVGKQIVLANIAVVATDPPQMNMTPSGQQMQIVWPGNHTGWRLLMNTNLDGTNWLDVTGTDATNSVSIIPTNGNAFFRLVYP